MQRIRKMTEATARTAFRLVRRYTATKTAGRSWGMMGQGTFSFTTA